MSDQGLRRVLENRDPRGHFSALSTWFTEEYKRSRENVGILHNQIVRPSTYQGQTVPTSDTRVGTSRHQRRVQWSGEVLDNQGEGTSVAEGVSSVVECCKPEWIEVGWKCYTCGRGLVARTIDPYVRVEKESDDSGKGAYIISCTPSGLSGRATTQSSSSSSSSWE